MNLYSRHFLLKTCGAIATIGVVAGSWPVYGLQFPATANRGAPARTAGGGVRGGGICTTTPTRLTAIMPTNNVGTTTQPDPSLFFFSPGVVNKSAEMMLKDSRGKVLYKTTVALPNTPGILQVQLPETLPDGTPLLAVDQTYSWRFSIVCDADDRAHDLLVKGLLERVVVRPELEAALKQTQPNSIERAEVYAQAGIWQETLAIAAKLRPSKPEVWTSLLQSVGLEKLAHMAVVN